MGDRVLDQLIVSDITFCFCSPLLETTKLLKTLQSSDLCRPPLWSFQELLQSKKRKSGPSPAPGAAFRRTHSCT